MSKTVPTKDVHPANIYAHSQYTRTHHASETFHPDLKKLPNRVTPLRQSGGDVSSSSAAIEMRDWGWGPRRYLNNVPAPHYRDFLPSPGGVSGHGSKLFAVPDVAVEDGQGGQGSPSLTSFTPTGPTRHDLARGGVANHGAVTLHGHHRGRLPRPFHTY